MRPDVRKVSDLPTAILIFFRGYAPKIGAQPQALNMIATVGQSRHRTSGGIAGRQSRVFKVGLSITVSLPMVIKESSDELNPPVIEANPALAMPRPARSAKDYLALAIATCGVGYLPLAPGTWGSLVGLGIYLLLQFSVFRFINVFLPPDSFLRFMPLPIFTASALVLITLITLVGIWAASRTEKLSGRKDPGKVVIDEVAGQLIALLPIVPRLDPGWMSIVVAFLLFRLFDIVKPYPARRLEKLESGLGIMSDDIVAGAYAAVGTSLIVASAMFIRS
jgi:phosphatidylglycerophosphatase A